MKSVFHSSGGFNKLLFAHSGSFWVTRLVKVVFIADGAVMALNSLDSVKRRIQALQQQADEAEDRAQVFQRELDEERDLREKVRLCAFFFFLLPIDERFADESIPP